MNSLNELSDYNLKWNISVKYQMRRNVRVVPQLEDVSTDERQTAGWVFLHNLQVLLSHLPHRWTTAFKQSRVVEIPFCKCNEFILFYYCIKKYQRVSLSVQARLWILSLYALPALMTPCTPASSMQRWTSLRCWMFPLAKTGMFTASLHKYNKRYSIRTKH